MTRLAYLPLLLIVLAASAASPASATSRIATLLGDGCENYGNQIVVGGSQVCNGGGDCENWGNQIFVGSTVSCDGSCPNHGVRISLGSDVCGNGDTQVCLGDQCVPWGPGEAGVHATTASSSYVDCIPRITPGQEFPPSIDLDCDPSGQPCGINQEPVCWTTRFLCMNALVAVLRAYDNNAPSILAQVREDSSCEGQPGWRPSSEAEVASTASAADCVPRVEPGSETVPSLHLECDPSGQPCGINQEPVCWTSRYACFMGLIAVLRVYDNQAERLPIREVRAPSSCEGQPGSPPMGDAEVAAT